MKKQENKINAVKDKRKVEVRVLVPWMIILVLFSVIFGLITGWFMHATALTNVKSEAISIVKELKSN